MMNKKISIYIVFLLAVVSSVKAQDFSFYNLGDYVAQTQNVSPVYIPKNSFTFGVANLGLDANSGFKLNELLVENGAGTLEYNFNNLLANADDQNNMNLDINANIFMMAFKTKKGSITLFSNIVSTINWQYSKEFLGIAANGISSFDLSNDRISSTAYSETGIGYTHQFMNKKLAIAVRLKYLNGIGHSSTADNASLSLAIDPASSVWTVRASEATLNTAGVNLADDENLEPFSGNTGFGFDFGVTYEITKKWNVELALNDISSSIDWTENVTNYNITNTTGAIYDGVDLNNGGDTGQQIEDAINNVIGTTETAESFKTTLAMKTYLSTKYQLSKKNAFTAVFFNRSDFSKPAYSVGYNRTMNKTTFGLLASTGGANDDFRFGANAILKLGFLQLYAATDNIAGIGGKVEDVQTANIRFGLNFTFGYNKWIKKRKLNEELLEQ